MYVSTVQDVMQINLLSFSQSELCLELRPRSPSNQSSNELDPLKLSVTWSHDNRFTLQVAPRPLIQLHLRIDYITDLQAETGFQLLIG